MARCLMLLLKTLFLILLPSLIIALPQLPFNNVGPWHLGPSKMYPFQKHVPSKPIFLNSNYQKRVGEELFHPDFLDQLWKQSQWHSSQIHQNPVNVMKDNQPAGHPHPVQGQNLQSGLQAQSGTNPHLGGMVAPSTGGMAVAPRPGGMVTAPGPGGMAAAPRPGGMVAAPGPGGMAASLRPGGMVAAPGPGGMAAVPHPGGMAASGGMQAQSPSSKTNGTKPAQSGQANSTKPTPAPPPPTTTPFRFIDQIDVTDENVFLFTAIAVAAVLARARGVDVLFFGPVFGKRSVDSELSSDDISIEILWKGVKLAANNSKSRCIQRAACEVPEKAELFAKVLDIMSWMVEVGSDWITVSPEYIRNVTGHLREGVMEIDSADGCDQMFPCPELSLPVGITLPTCLNCTSEMPN